MKKNDKKRPIPFVRRLCAHLSDEEIEEAEENLRKYIRLALQIHRRNATNPDENRPDLTAPCKKSFEDKSLIKIVFTKAEGKEG